VPRGARCGGSFSVIVGNVKINFAKTYSDKMKKPLARTQKEIDDHLIRAESERYANPRNAKQHCKQALELAESISDTRRIAKAPIDAWHARLRSVRVFRNKISLRVCLET
jgi:hypothetical protein